LIFIAAAVALTPAALSQTLENGVRVVAIPLPNSRTFSAQVFVRAGSAFESAASHGSTHLLEHLMFADGGADKIAENAGFLLNATTYREFVRLHATGPAQQWKAGILATARLLDQPLYSAEKDEWRIVKEEDALARLDPNELLYRRLWSERASESPWGLASLGNTSAADPPAGMKQLWEKHFVGPNIVAVIAGAFGSEEAVMALSSAFGNVRGGAAVSPPALPVWAGGKHAEAFDRLAVSGVAPGYDKPSEYVAFEVALGALTSPARLETAGLEALSFLSPSSKGSLAIIVYSSADGAPGAKSRALRSIDTPISEAEFADAKRRVRSRYASETPVNRGLVGGLSMLFTSRRIDFVPVVDSVSLAEVAAAAGAFRP
jgi:predicted Zn-dependent peptidase